MSYEDALRQIEFLEKALDGAIALSKIEARHVGMPQEHLCTNRSYAWCRCNDEPELAKYIIWGKKEKKK
jgi:hypothetical protein